MNDAHETANAMLDAIERLIEAQIAATPEARPVLAARLARMFPEIAPKPQPSPPAPAADETGPLVWQQVKDLLAVLGRYRMTAAEFEKRGRVLAHADAMIAAQIKPATETKRSAA